jgi:rubrerythrin
MPSHGATRVPGTLLGSPKGVDTITLLRRATHIEELAAEIYGALAERFVSDPILHGFWAAMSEDERKHAKKLLTWRRLLESTPPERHPSCDGFSPGLRELEGLAQALRERAAGVKDVEDAFSEAFALESSELDLIYTRLLQSSPIARFPDLEETRRCEIGRHHEALLEMVRARSKNEANRIQAALLAAEEP